MGTLLGRRAFLRNSLFMTAGLTLSRLLALEPKAPEVVKPKPLVTRKIVRQTSPKLMVDELVSVQREHPDIEVGRGFTANGRVYSSEVLKKAMDEHRAEILKNTKRGGK